MSYAGIEYPDSHFLREARAHIDALEAAQLALLRRVWRALGCDPNPSDFMRSEQAAMWEQAIKMIEEASEQDRRFDRERRDAEGQVQRVRDHLAWWELRREYGPVVRVLREALVVPLPPAPGEED